MDRRAGGADYEKLTVKSVKYQKNNLILNFAESDSIEKAELLKNSVIFAERKELGELPEGVYYIADLIGLTVKKETGEIIGRLKNVLQTGANDIYEVEREGLKDLLIPVIDGVVLSVDILNRFVTVRLLEGLEEL